MITDKDFETAKETIKAYAEQKTHLIRDDIENDCPSEDFEIGKPEGECDSDGHYMCDTCIHANLESFWRLKGRE